MENAMTNEDFFSFYKNLKLYPIDSLEYVLQYCSGKKIVLYGAGVYGQRFVEENEKKHIFEIVAWVDKSFEEKSIELNKHIDAPDAIINIPNFDYVFIALKKKDVVQEIRKYLHTEFHIDDNKIISFDMLLSKDPVLEKVSSSNKSVPKTEWKDCHNRIDLPKPYVCTSMICNQEFLDAPIAQYWMQKIGEWPITYWRKIWEYVYICQGLYERGMLAEGKKGVAFGIGEEPLPDLFASFGCHILATDLNANESMAKGWMASNQNAGGDLEKLRQKRICDKETFYSHVSYRDVNMNDIPEDIKDYDFCWSTCALEHLGGIKPGLEFIKNSLNTLKPGGIAIHTTEYNLYSNDATFEHEACSLYRRKDIECLIDELKKLGHYVYPMDWHLGTGIVDHFIDLPPYQREIMHLRLLIQNFPCTSIGIIIKKRITC